MVLPSDGTGALVESPWLLLELDGLPCAIPLSAVEGVVEPDTIRAVRRAPAGVCGLSHWRGSLITVLAADGPASGADPQQRYLVRLGGRHSGTAIRLARAPRVGWSTSDPAGEAILCDGASFRRVDPATLLAELLRPDGA